MRVRQGMIEQSNVKSVLEITNLIEVSRAYERVAKIVDQTEDLSRAPSSGWAGRSRRLKPMQALRTAATGMLAQQLNVEVISNNIANMNTGRLQASAGRVPGSDVPDAGSGRRPVVGVGQRSCRPACRSATA
jgi:flagellar basal body rod protein FlgF